MAKEIKFKYTQDGVEQTITTFQQFQDRIKSLQDQLKNADIGTENYKKLHAPRTTSYSTTYSL